MLTDLGVSGFGYKYESLASLDTSHMSIVSLTRCVCKKTIFIEINVDAICVLNSSTTGDASSEGSVQN